MWKPITSTLTMLGLIAATGACAHVPRQEFDTEIARLQEQQEQLREHLETTDGQLANRLESVEGDVDAVSRRIDAVDERVAAVRADLTELETEYGVTVERLEGLLAFDVPVHFEYDSDVVRETDEPVLDRFAAIAAAHYPESLITVEGFADPAGSQAYNLDLGRRRAEAVAGHLDEAGLDPQRIRTVSYGEAPERQVLPGAWGDDGMANRRVTLVIETAGGDWDLTTARGDSTDAPAGTPVAEDLEASTGASETSTDGESTSGVR